MLTGTAWGGQGPRAFLLAGGIEQGDDDGYGPARQFTPEEVKTIAQEIASIAPDDLWAKYDAKRMNSEGIYPEIWDEKPDDLQEEYLDYFEILQEFLTEVAQASDGLQIVMQ